MKIRNKGSKIINIGTTILMPDASMDINEATLKLPAIQAFIAKGLLETDESDAAFQKAVEEAAARKLEEEAKAKAEAEAKAKAEADAKAKAEAEAAAKKAAEDKAKADAAMKAIQYIRLIGKEFISLTDAELHLWVEMVRPMVSRKQFGKLYEQAIAYLVCHKLKMAGYGENPLGDMGAIGIGFAVGSVSEGGSSISFGANQSSNLATDAELGLTAYGVQFLQLRRMVIVPIHCSGELDSSGGKGKNNPCIVPVASDAVLGGIKVRPGSGLKLEPDGTLSVDREEP